ncbi:hypothetical protein JXL19_03390 [bacterium]|nr:hypothetical protein [bacterium]
MENKEKNNISIIIIIFTIILISSISLCAIHWPVFAANAVNEIDISVTRKAALLEQATLITLKALVQSMDGLEIQIKRKEKEFHEAKTEGQKVKIAQEISDMNSKLDEMRRNFEEISTGVALEDVTVQPKKSFDWQEEVQELLGPIMQEIRNITAHPRELERLRSEISYIKKRIPVIERGIQNIKNLIGETDDQELNDYLKNLEIRWSSQNKQLSNQLAVAEYKLSEKLQGKTSFVESAQKLFRIFFKSRGKNLLLALIAFFFVWVILRYLHLHLFNIGILKMSGDRSLFNRLTNVAYNIFSFIGAMGASLLILYVSGDWVLLGLILIFLLGVIWAARQAIPMFWEQGKLLLNVGPVKENERLVYNGIPWKVKSINLYTELINPELKGGRITLPLKDIINMRSRPYDPDEIWFPCRENDWVLLTDGTFGKVVNQTPEIVELVLRGGSRKTYPAIDFLNQAPINISTNFRVNVTFGIDYEHQAICTQEVPEKLKNTLIEKLKKKGYEKTLLNLDVEFKQAGASSLDLEIMADFSGEAAKDYFRLSRTIQRICVDACNTNGWVIPFTQVTIHNAQN